MNTEEKLNFIKTSINNIKTDVGIENNKSLQELLDTIDSVKLDLVNNLVEKGIEATEDETFTSLVPKVNDIETGGDLSEYFATPETFEQGWLRRDYVIKTPDVIIPDTWTNLTRFAERWFGRVVPKIVCGNNITSMGYMYSACGALDIDLSGLDTSNVTSMSYMFENCSNVSNLDVSKFNTSNVKGMNNMFYYCSNLTSLDVSNFDTSQVTSYNNMFYHCDKLTSLDLSNFTTDNASGINVASMFGYSANLTHIDLRNFNFEKVGTAYANMFGVNAGTGVPDNCEIIVKDDTAKTWITGKFTRLTNVKTVAELEA